jgi:hypothetical protein
VSTEHVLPDYPSLAYAETRVGLTVRGGHTMTRAQAANVIALARPAHRVGPIYSSTTTAYVYAASYVRSHSSIRYLWLAWYYHPGTSGINGGVTLTIRDAAGNSVASSSTKIPRGFKGESPYNIRASFYDSNIATGGSGYLDLDALAATLTDPSWTFEFAAQTGGFETIEGWECPRSQVDDSETYGVLTGPENPGNSILSSSYERLAKTVEGAITCNRTLFSLSWPEDTASLSPSTTSATLTAFALLTEGGGVPVPFHVRPRVVYAPNSATGEPHRVRVLYRVTGGGTGTVEAKSTSVGAGSANTATLNTLTSATWAWSAWQTLQVATNGTDRIAHLTFRGKVTAGALYIASIVVEENNT